MLGRICTVYLVLVTRDGIKENINIQRVISFGEALRPLEIAPISASGMTGNVNANGDVYFKCIHDVAAGSRIYLGSTYVLAKTWV